MSQYASNYPAGADSDQNAPWNQVDEPEDHFNGEKDVRHDGIDYLVTGDGHGNVEVCFADCEGNRDLRGWIPNDLYNAIVDKANNN